jgi:hypothetical protein
MQANGWTSKQSDTIALSRGEVRGGWLVAFEPAKRGRGGSGPARAADTCEP